MGVLMSFEHSGQRYVFQATSHFQICAVSALPLHPKDDREAVV
jgi:hypothetical protein